MKIVQASWDACSRQTTHARLQRPAGELQGIPTLVLEGRSGRGPRTSAALALSVCKPLLPCVKILPLVGQKPFLMEESFLQHLLEAVQDDRKVPLNFSLHNDILLF